MADEVGPALGVYIHWPYCARICPYCDFNVVRDRGREAEQAALVEAIADDLRAHAAITGPMRLASIFLGGGTPSLMAPAAAGRLIALCKSLWPAEPDLEVTLEANPTDAEAERFADFARAGVNRLSLGVQALDDAALQFLGRNHDAAAAIRAVEVAAAVFPSLSLDLIYALPGQTPAAWAQALRQADALGAAHISAYQLTIAGGTPFERAVQRGRFAPVDPDLAATLYETTQATLEGLGYVAYEISNHAKRPAARSRHNLVYWRGEAYVGVGPGAHGRLATPDGRLAVEAQARISDYIAAVAQTGRGWASSELLEPRAVQEERIFMGLRTDEGVAASLIAAVGAGAKAEVLIAAGLLRLAHARISATPQGRLVLDRLVAELLT
jgi:oxygen-independent coproporphyrinogen-3 oxidase